MSACVNEQMDVYIYICIHKEISQRYNIVGFHGFLAVHNLVPKVQNPPWHCRMDLIWIQKHTKSDVNYLDLLEA